MQKSHAKSWLGVGVLFAGVVYSVILFLVKPGLDASQWVLYGATIAAFLLLALQLVTSARSGSGMVMDVASLIITLVYFFIQLILGGIVFMGRDGLPLTTVVVCEIILLAVYLGLTFIMNAARSHSTAQDRNNAAAVQRMRRMEADVRNMADSESSPSIKKALNDLAEEIHYCTPVSSPGAAAVESRIETNLSILHAELANRNGDPMRTIDLIRNQLKERSRL